MNSSATVRIGFLLARCIGFIVRGLRAVGIRQWRNQQVIVPPSGWGSVGDEAMLTFVVGSAADRQLSGSVILQGSHGTSWAGRLSLIDDSCYGVEMTRSQRRLPLWGLISAVRSISSAQELVIIGADVIDGAYGNTTSLSRLLLAEMACASGLKVTFTGFSFSARATPESVEGFRLLSPSAELSCRDPVSAKRFQAATGRDIRLSADLAFLAGRFARQPAGVAASADHAPRPNTARIGITLNHHALGRRHDGSVVDPRDYVKSTVAGLSLWLRKSGLKSIAVLPVPSDNRDPNEPQSDYGLCRLLAKTLQDEAWAEVVAPVQPMTLASMQQTLRSLDFLVSGRMHACILALNEGVPILAVEYAGKFRGMMDQFSTGDVGILMTPRQFLQPKLLSDALAQTWERKLQLRSAIATGIGAVRDRAESGFLISRTDGGRPNENLLAGKICK